MPERQLTIQQKRYLKFAHLFFAALWGGGATTMVLLFCLFHPSTAHEQITFSKILFYIDFIIVGPGARRMSSHRAHLLFIWELGIL